MPYTLTIDIYSQFNANLTVPAQLKYVKRYTIPLEEYGWDYYVKIIVNKYQPIMVCSGIGLGESWYIKFTRSDGRDSDMEVFLNPEDEYFDRSNDLGFCADTLYPIACMALENEDVIHAIGALEQNNFGCVIS